MKTKLFSIAALSLLCVIMLSCAGGKKELPNVTHSLKGNVKEIRETNVYKGKTTLCTFSFNEKGQLTGMLLSTPNGNKTVKVDYLYDPDGSISNRTRSMTEKVKDNYAMDNMFCDISLFEPPFQDYNYVEIMQPVAESQTETTTWSKDKKGNSVEQTTVGDDTLTRVFNKEGKLISSTSYYASSDYTIEYIFDPKTGKTLKNTINGEEQELYDYDDDDVEGCGEGTTQHDEQGRLISSENDCMNEYYTYNDEGYITSIKSSDRWWGEAETLYEDYEFDSEGNWIKRTLKKRGGMYERTPFTMTTTREIVYY